jgi:hypothetical protein
MRVIIKWISKKSYVRMDWVGSGLRELAGTCECGNEPSEYIKCGEFLD